MNGAKASEGDCKPDLHYVVDMSRRLMQIKKMVDAGQYFPERNEIFDEKSRAWTREGFLEAVKILLSEPNTLFV